ncbi:MAG: tetratricopeptide repeat protein [Planctomycetota bacterium]|jgi:tetratricopeptide (TPR) repeat protein
MATIAELVREAYSHWDDAAVVARTGRELHDRNRLELAREVLARALELGAGDSDTWATYAYAHLRGFRPDQGLEILRQGVERTGLDPLRSVLAGFTSDTEERQALQEHLQESDDPVVRAGLASARLWAGDQSAFAELRDLYEKHAHDPDIRDTWLWIMFASGGRPGGEQIDLRREVVPVVDEKIAADPERVSGHWMKAQLLHLAQEWDALLEATEAALARFPDEETLMYLRGRAFRENGDHDRAAQCLARAIGMKPSFAGARAELGKVYEAQGMLDLAEEIFREIPRANPDYAAGPVSLALFLGRQGRWDEAETLFCETWSRLHDWQQARVRQQPDAAPLLARERVQAALGEDA